jgi:hypothetical protein
MLCSTTRKWIDMPDHFMDTPMVVAAPRTLCPSAPAKPGALLIGIIIGDRTAFLQPTVAVTADDLSDAGDDVEKRFRFSAPCLRGGCGNFGEDHCNLIRRLVRVTEDGGALPECSIRSRCEWFSTAGAPACDVCPHVRRPGIPWTRWREGGIGDATAGDPIAPADESCGSTGDGGN